jgi:hypothetical protein
MNRRVVCPSRRPRLTPACLQLPRIGEQFSTRRLGSTLDAESGQYWEPKPRSRDLYARLRRADWHARASAASPVSHASSRFAKPPRSWTSWSFGSKTTVSPSFTTPSSEFDLQRRSGFVDGADHQVHLSVGRGTFLSNARAIGPAGRGRRRSALGFRRLV